MTEQTVNKAAVFNHHGVISLTRSEDEKTTLNVLPVVDFSPGSVNTNKLIIQTQSGFSGRLRPEKTNRSNDCSLTDKIHPSVHSLRIWQLQMVTLGATQRATTATPRNSHMIHGQGSKLRKTLFVKSISGVCTLR